MYLILKHKFKMFCCFQSLRKTEIYLFLYVTTIPTTEAKKAIGASLQNKNSYPHKTLSLTSVFSH